MYIPQDLLILKNILAGDIVYYDDQQNFFVVDRLKELIKYKGFQVREIYVNFS